MNSCMNRSDTAYFDYLLRLASMDAAKESNPVTIPEPPITTYDPVYYPMHPTSVFPDITTFDFFDQMFDFNFHLSLTSTSRNGPLPDPNKQCKQEDVVAKPVLPENIGLTTFFDFESLDLNNDFAFSLPSNSEPESEFTESSSSSSSKQTRVVPRLRPRRAALRLRYTSYEQRLQSLTEDPFVLDILVDENKVICAGCEKDIQLDNRRPKSLHLQNWKTHKARCVGIKLDTGP